MYRRLVVAMGSLTLGLCTALAQGGGTVLDGVYTKEQATRGQETYEAQCRSCHEGTDQDGPDLKGADFVDRWRGDRLNALFTQIKTNMPGNKPGSLSESTSLDILAFLLSENGLPAGSRELTADVTRTVEFVGQDGPKPLPSMTGVLMVGCLTAGPNDTWVLTNASEPVRSRSLNDTTPEELQGSASRPLGTQRFRLQNVGERAAATKGGKVQAKGVLIRQYMNDRINVTSLETVASTCQ
jgi:mono/diheme cytochrome c family protein